VRAPSVGLVLSWWFGGKVLGGGMGGWGVGRGGEVGGGAWEVGGGV